MIQGMDRGPQAGSGNGSENKKVDQGGAGVRVVVGPWEDSVGRRVYLSRCLIFLMSK